VVTELAYFVIREGKWCDVCRLIPGQSVTIGRAPSNQIVIRDERCSRNHAEVFLSEGNWVVRDLESRNGTMVGDQLLKKDQVLHPGDIVRIGQCQLVFVNRLSEAFPDSAIAVVRPQRPEDTMSVDEAAALPAYEPATITHRRGQTRFLTPDEADESGISRLGRAAANLCRLAFDLAKAPDVVGLAELALVRLFESTKVDSGAVLLVPREFRGEPHGADLEIVASQTSTEHRYHRVSNLLAATVVHEGEAVLARNILGDSELGTRDSKGEILATGAICAPIRQGQKLLGLVHLYSTDPQRAPDPEDLEFTLAVADTLAVALANLNQRQELAEDLTQVRIENVQLRERLGVQSEMVGTSPGMRLISEEMGRAAVSKATLLIRGESGVGKELVARAVHYSSPRRRSVFVCLNCAALSEDLLASELFGHERGAFTGATDRKIGKFEAAHGGTLMLDEIGEMTPGIQAKFLRVLEGHPFERVGGSKPIKVDVRVIAATNRDLERDVAEGRFRRDLFFRLRVLEIVVPPLRKRPEDIVELATHFLEKFKAETGRKIRGFSDRAVQKLTTYRWPGNVRELKNVVERAVVLCRNDMIDQEDLLLSKLSTAGDTSDPGLFDRTFRPCSIEDMERVHILNTLQHTNWNKSRAAILLGVERSTLDRKIRRYALVEGSSAPPPCPVGDSGVRPGT
jgi:Nif-specific regulatory protein